MLSILGSLIGFGSSIVPEVLGFFKQSQANKQELAMLEARAKYAESLSELKIEELDAQADIAETKGIYEHDRSLTSDGFVSQLRASVRPVITYLFSHCLQLLKYLHLLQLCHRRELHLPRLL